MAGFAERFERAIHDWPPVYVGRSVLPGDIKSVSVETLVRLQEAATGTDWVSAVGRPRWVADHTQEIDQVLLTVFSIECPGWHRCHAYPIGDDRVLGKFTLGVSAQEFNELPPVPWPTAMEILRGSLLRAEFVPLDPR